MDRRQRKTREAIFAAFTELLSEKAYEQITVGEIINRADIGRSTFYAHFETKDFLLKELCEELFCHVFDAAGEGDDTHRHIFACSKQEPVFLHLLRHLQRNDCNLLKLLSCPSNALFLQYFKRNLRAMIANQLALFEARKSEKLPEAFWINHIAATFVETVQWWIDNGMKQSPETIAEYFFLAV